MLQRLFKPNRYGAFSRSNLRKVLYLSEPHELAQTQFFPFFSLQLPLRERYGIEFRELPLSKFVRGTRTHHEADVVCFQTWFDYTPDRMRKLVEDIRSSWPYAKIVYFDFFAPLDLRYAEVLTPLVDTYVKKQVFDDFDEYGKPTIGHTNLSDWYSNRYNVEDEITTFKVPSELQEKIVVGTNFDLSERLSQLPLYYDDVRPIDIHARLATNGTPWYAAMRTAAMNAIRSLDRWNVLHDGMVKHRTYMNELRQSKLCFSPFGYGEVCWRDFEAMASGALLIKPDMSHLKVWRDYYQPFRTYIPLAWDFSDLEEKCARYLSDDKARREIAENAKSFLLGATKEFLDHPLRGLL